MFAYAMVGHNMVMLSNLQLESLSQEMHQNQQKQHCPNCPVVTCTAEVEMWGSKRAQLSFPRQQSETSA